MPSASSQLLGSIKQNNANTGISSSGSASSRLIQGSQISGSQYKPFRSTSEIAPTGPIQVQAPEQNIFQKAGSFIKDKATSVFSKPETLKLPSGADLTILSKEPTKSATSLLNEIDLSPDKDKRASAQFTDQVKNEVAKFYQPEVVRERRNKAREEIKASIKQIRPGYEEPNIFGSVVEAIKQSSVDAVGSLGATAEMVGNMTNSIALTKIGEKLNKEANKILASNPEWGEAPDAPWSGTKVARLVASAVPSLLATVASVLVAGPVGGVATAFSLESGPTYKEAIDSGVEEDKARFYGVTVGTVNAILETIFPSKLINKKQITKEATEKVSKSLAVDLLTKAKDFGVKFTKDGTLEGSTEVLQELWSNVVATNYDENRNLWDNLLEAFVGGFGSGGIAGNTLEGGNYTPQEVLDNVIGSSIQDTEEGKSLIKKALEAKDQGASVLIETKEDKEQSKFREALNKGIPGASEKLDAVGKVDLTEDNQFSVPDQSTTDAVIIDPDQFKKEANDFDPKNHEIYSQMAKDKYTSALKTNPNQVVKFTAGGSGSGKSELLLKGMVKDFNGIVVDGTFSKHGTAVDKINEALNAKKDIEISAILPDIEKAWSFAQKRGDKTGRYVPVDEFIKMHMGFVETIKKIAEESPNIDIKLLDVRGKNTKEDAKNTQFITDNKQIIDILSNVRYNEVNLKERLLNVSKQTKENIAESGTKKKVSGKSGEGKSRAKEKSSSDNRLAQSSGVSPKVIEGVVISDEEVIVYIGGDETPGNVVYENGKKIGEVAVDDGQIVGLISDEKGAGTKIVRELLKKEDRYYVRSTPQAKGFWEKMGIKDFRLNKDVNLYEGLLYKKDFENINAQKNKTSISDQAYKQTVKNGGVTISLQGNEPSNGFAYAPFKDTETIIKKEEFSEKDVTDFIAKHKEKLSKDGNHLGLWEDDGNIYIDISKVGDPTADTLEKAMSAQQLAVFDLGAFEEITLGEIKNGKYNRLYEKAINHPYLNKGQESGATSKRTDEKPQDLPGKEKVSLDNDPQKKFDQQGKEKDPPIKKGKGAIFDRVYDELRLESNVEDNFDSITLREQAEKATTYMQANPKEAIEVSLRQKPAPVGITFEAINIATSKQALANGEMQLYTDLVSARSIIVSRSAQSLGQERLVNSLSTDSFVQEVFRSRILKLSTKAGFISKFKALAKGKGKISLGLDIMSESATNLKNSIDRKVKAKIASAQEIIDSLTC